MSDAARNSERALTAARAICDGRDPRHQRAPVLVTLEHTVATILLATANGDGRKAAAMLNEGLTPGVKARLAVYAAKAQS